MIIKVFSILGIYCVGFLVLAIIANALVNILLGGKR